VQVFLRVTTQVRYAGWTAWPTGIEHQSVWPVIHQFVELRGEDCPPGYALTLFEQFRAIEAEVVSALQERHKQQQQRGRK